MARRASKLAEKVKESIAPPIFYNDNGEASLEFHHAEYKVWRRIRKESNTQIGAPVISAWEKGNKAKAFTQFLTDVGAMPFNCFHLVRKNDALGWGPGNTRWITKIDPRRVLSFDPGPKNFGAAFIRKGKIRKSFMVDFALPNIRAETFEFEMSRYVFGIEKLIAETKPTLVVMERFVPRRFGTNAAEVINLMAGYLAAICNRARIGFQLIMSTTWKNHFNRVANLNNLYKEINKAYRIPPHQVDSSLIGRFFVVDRKFSADCVKWIIKNLAKFQVEKKPRTRTVKELTSVKMKDTRTKPTRRKHK